MHADGETKLERERAKALGEGGPSQPMRTDSHWSELGALSASIHSQILELRRGSLSATRVPNALPKSPRRLKLTSYTSVSQRLPGRGRKRISQYGQRFRKQEFGDKRGEPGRAGRAWVETKAAGREAVLFSAEEVSNDCSGLE